MATEITDNNERRRYELLVHGKLAALITYGRTEDTLALTHTETIEGFERQGLATQLVKHVVDEAQEQGLGVLPFCPFVKHYLIENDLLSLVPRMYQKNFGIQVAS